MSELHLIVNFDKKEYLNPEDFADPSNVRHFSDGGRGGVMQAFAFLMEKPTRQGLSSLSERCEPSQETYLFGEKLTKIELGGADVWFKSPPWMGRWCGDRVGIISDNEYGFDNRLLSFAEQLRAVRTALTMYYNLGTQLQEHMTRLRDRKTVSYGMPAYADDLRQQLRICRD